MKFSEEETVKLVELYAEYECLWNLGLASYKNRNLRLAAEEVIVARFSKPGFGINEFKQKMKNLRCTYNQECNKIQKSKKSGSGTVDIYVPNIKWFFIMDIIIKNAKGNKTAENSVESIIHQTHNTEGNSNIEFEEIDMAESSEHEMIDAEPVPRGMVEIMPSHTSSSTLGLNNKRSFVEREKVLPAIKKKKMQHLADAVKGLQQVSDSLSRETETISEEEAFGNWVTASLKKLPMAQSLMAQHEIQGTLLRFRLNAISPQEPNNGSSLPSFDSQIVHDKQNIGREVELEYEQY